MICFYGHKHRRIFCTNLIPNISGTAFQINRLALNVLVSIESDTSFLKKKRVRHMASKCAYLI
jgi:hypothetical protein